VSSGTIEVMAWRFFFVSRGFSRRRRSLRRSGQLNGLRPHGSGVASESGIVMVGVMAEYEGVGNKTRELDRDYSQCAIELCISHGCEGWLYALLFSG
jgi:hypothetical protein